MQPSKAAIVRLSENAYRSLNEMLNTLSTQDENIKINASKLMSFVVLEYYDRHFEKSKDRIVQTHKDKRKDASNKLRVLSEDELENVIKFLDKLKRDEPYITR